LVKAPRLINARADAAKLLFGAIGQAVDSVIFSNVHFIKKVAWHLRVRTIKKRLVRSGLLYHNLDYTSFECSFGKEWVEKIECYFLDKIADFCPKFMDLVQGILGPTLAGIQKIRNIFYRALVEATRMSGEMFTSSFNGLANYILVTFLYGDYLFDFFLEGDDNILACTAEPPDIVKRAASLGFHLKLTRLAYPGDASFCGLVFCEDSDHPIRDASYILAKFGWTDPRYHGSGLNLKRRLLRAKALSLGYENGRCPILWKLAEKFLHLTDGAKLGKLAESRVFSQYERERMAEAFQQGPDVGEPDVALRVFYEKMYGISVKHQLKIEQEIDNYRTGPMSLPSMIFPAVYSWFYMAYVGSANLPFASLIWNAGGGGTSDDLYTTAVIA
jgi:hypothetical protein